MVSARPVKIKNKIVKKVVKKTAVKQLAKKSTVKKPPKKSKRAPVFKKFFGNPIVAPKIENNWESKAAFNPAALYENGKVHILYRAIGDSDISVLGYASSADGLNIIERLSYPAYAERRKSWLVEAGALPSQIFYTSGGGWGGGVEDPRLTVLEGRVYMLYTSFDGWGSVRIALTSIGLGDFLG